MSAPPAPSSAAPASPAAQASGVAAPHCANCGNLVVQEYCGHCGQRLEPPVHSLVHFSSIAAEDLTHADSRLWSTIGALLLKPGFLTAEFLAGRRVRYLPPIRLYLVLSLAFFVFASATQPQLQLLQFSDDAKVPHVVPLTTVTAARSSQETPEQRQHRICADANYDGPWARTLQPLFKRSCVKTIEDDGRELQVAFLHNLPRAMFVFLPLLAGIMMLLYWRPRHYYVEHLLLLVHNHACVFLVTMLVATLARLIHPLAGMLQFAAWVYFAWYIFRSMRVAYGQSRLLTAAKFAVLAGCYALFGALTLAITSIYSALML